MRENVHEKYFVSEKWGVLVFFPTKTIKYKETCKKCLLLLSNECVDAHCTSMEREDEMNGYFSKHEMPKEGKK